VHLFFVVHLSQCCLHTTAVSSFTYAVLIAVCCLLTCTVLFTLFCSFVHTFCSTVYTFVQCCLHIFAVLFTHLLLWCLCLFLQYCLYILHSCTHSLQCGFHILAVWVTHICSVVHTCLQCYCHILQCCFRLIHIAVFFLFAELSTHLFCADFTFAVLLSLLSLLHSAFFTFFAVFFTLLCSAVDTHLQ